jgi:hypothetical protein
MSLDEILDNHQMFTLRGGYWADKAMVKHNSEQTKEAILKDLLDIIGEDEKPVIDDSGLDGRFCATCDCLVDGDFDIMECRCDVRNKLRQELREAVMKYCE